jgi:aspartokinase-like uncharacterized kinase
MRAPVSPPVIKVGGSLFDWPDLPGRLASFLEVYSRSADLQRPILIAGGGGAADWVCDLDRIHRLGDEAAHRLALHALDLSAVVLSALLPRTRTVDSVESARCALDLGLVPVLVPRQILGAIEQSGKERLPASWDVTSDSIAAVVAAHVGAKRLTLLKSRSLHVHATRSEAARLGLVDRFFPEAAQALPRVEYLNLRDPSARIEALLS